MTSESLTSKALAPILDPQWVAGRGRLSQSIKLEEEGPSRFVAASIVVIVALMAFLLVWSSVTEVSEMAAASGEVTPVGSVQKVQHLEGGIVSAIYVREGDLVEAGQVLMKLDSGLAAPELKQQQVRLAALELQESQLRALGQGPQAKATRSAHADQKFSGLADSQDAVLRDKRRELASQEAVLRRQVEEQRASIDNANVQARNVREQIGILEEQIRSRQSLVDEGYVPRSTLLDQQRELSRTRGQLAELQGMKVRSQEAMAAMEARIGELHARSSLDSNLEISKVRSEIAELRETVQRAQDRVERLVVRAPVRGIVKGPMIENVGGVVASGATLLEVIPVDAQLIVEARVLNKDIGFVHVGQPARVKVGSYDYTRFGSIDGNVETTSATTFTDERGNPFYRVRIRLSKNHVGEQAGHHMVIPGMTVLADIKTGQKSILAYLLKPIMRTANEAMHER